MQLEKQLKEMNERYNYITNKANWYLDIMNHRIPDNSDPGTWSISSSESQENSSESQIMTKHDVS